MRSIIVALVFIVGFLFCAGGVGSMEFEAAASNAEFLLQAIKAAAGMILMILALTLHEAKGGNRDE